LPPACLQQFSSGDAGVKVRKYFNNPGGPAPSESEDCLYTNVYVPEGTKEDDDKAVLFWIYGGNK
jgi:carboxylesterase type B